MPWIMKAGKALNERKVEIRVQYKPPAAGIHEHLNDMRNELVVRPPRLRARLIRRPAPPRRAARAPGGGVLAALHDPSCEQAPQDKGLCRVVQLARATPLYASYPKPKP